MALKTFVSSKGVLWHVWSVIPGSRESDERRRGYERRSPDPVLAYKGPERRATPDRRRRATLFSAALAAGWLTFESPTERRRLVPIPPAWDSCSDARLERLCEQAQVILTFPSRGDQGG
jgi:hypothetical protein